jgi:hypothetical protein
LTVDVLLQDIKKIETDALVVGFFEDVRPLKGFAGELDWLLCGALSSLLLGNKVRGSLGDVALLTSQGKVPAQKLFMIGLGTRTGITPSRLRNAARIAAEGATRAGAGRMAVECFHSSDKPGENDIAALLEGLNEGAETRALNVSLLAPDATSYEKIQRTVKTWSSGDRRSEHHGASKAEVLR